MAKVSIVVPIYNSENTLQKCLDSILNSTLEDIEVLCLDDVSQDNSRQIVDEYAQKDKRIIPIHLSGKGSYGRAVNLGFQKASSEYIGIVESDDTIAPEMYETLLNIALETNSDVAMASYYFVKPDNTCQYINLLQGITLDEENVFNASTQPIIVYKSSYPWKNLYKKSFLFENDIKFREDKGGSYQDLIFNALLLSKAKRITATTKPLYYYDLYNVSASSNTSSTLVLYPKRRLQARDVYIDNNLYENKEIREYFWKACYGGVKFFYRRCNNKCNFFNEMKTALTTSLADEIDYKYFDKRQKRDLKRIIKYNYATYTLISKITKFLPQIFTMYNEKSHKIIKLFNCIKLSIKYKSYKKLYNAAKQIRQNQKEVLKRLKEEFGTRPIRVAFLIAENQKWNVTSLYRLFEKSPYFEPYVVVSLLKWIYIDKENYRSGLKENIEFFKSLDVNLIISYDEEQKKYIDLESYKFDIIFYSSPWSEEFHKTQWIHETSKNSLLCYIPYAIAEAPSSMILNKLFFESIFKLFVADKIVINEYKKRVIKQNGESIVATGHTKLDEYYEPPKKIDTNKPIVIYAPHFTIGKRFFSTGTFDWNGKFILEYAKSHPEYHWVFKPHPLVKSEFIRTGFMDKEDIENYYLEWAKIGTVYEKGKYFDIFRNSECLITDCASFLLEYYPTQKPVIRLLSKTYTYNNALTEMIAKNYYITRNINELKKNLELILEKHQDPKKKIRLKNLNLFQPERELAAKKIYDVLLNELSKK